MCVNSNAYRYTIVGIALVVSLLASILSSTSPSGSQAHSLQMLGMVSRFFEIMIPFLAVGSLIKYLFSNPQS
ncbi:MAG: hypothetical protein CMF51_00430 [Legionellales bacterium]|nr:hypothetical protein [Legionellales bacterium]